MTIKLKKKKDSRSLRTIFLDFCEVTTFLYVVPKLISPIRTGFRFIYLLGIAISIAAFLMTSTHLIQKLTLNEVNTKIERLEFSEAEFPTVRLI
jgi:hypothetical protein